jgi:hypothetical protein
VILEDSRTWVEGEDEEDDGVDDLVWFDLLEELGLGTLGHNGEGAAGRFPQREETSSPGESGTDFECSPSHVLCTDIDLNAADNL